jgi:hypothetical protein
MPIALVPVSVAIDALAVPSRGHTLTAIHMHTQQLVTIAFVAAMTTLAVAPRSDLVPERRDSERGRANQRRLCGIVHGGSRTCALSPARTELSAARRAPRVTSLENPDRSNDGERAEALAGTSWHRQAPDPRVDGLREWTAEDRGAYACR